MTWFKARLHFGKSITLKNTVQYALDVGEQISQAQTPPDVKPKKGREVVETTQKRLVTYQAELVKCGKANCRCMTEGKLHGPYWYGYRKQGQKLKSWYVGKELKLLDEADELSGG